MLRSCGTRRRLGLESLEDRWLMAGDVTATLKSGTLILEGDAAANAVIVATDHTNGKISVTGATDVGTTPTPGTPTTINGLASAEFEGVKNIRVNLKGSDDSLLLTDVSLTGGVRVFTGDGNDNVLIGGIPDGPPAGLDTARIPAELLAATAHSVTIGGNLLIDTGKGDDLVSEAGLTVMHNMIVDTGRGNDHVFLGAFTDASTTTTLVTATPMGVTVGRGSLILTGAGDDTVSMADVTGKATLVLTGAGADKVSIDHSSFTVLAVALRGGDDSLDVTNTTTTKATFFNGGQGTNTLNDLTAAGDTLAHLHTRHFA